MEDFQANGKQEQLSSIKFSAQWLKNHKSNDN